MSNEISVGLRYTHRRDNVPAHVILQLKPGGTTLVFGIHNSDLDDPGVVLRGEIDLEDWTRLLPTRVALLERAIESSWTLVRAGESVDQVFDYRVGRLGPWQFSFQATTKGNRARCVVTLCGRCVRTSHVLVEEGARVGGTCYLDSKLPELPDLVRRLEKMQTRYVVLTH